MNSWFGVVGYMLLLLLLMSIWFGLLMLWLLFDVNVCLNVVGVCCW